MSMSSLADTFKQLEKDLGSNPVRIAAHSDMPFAIFRYDPTEEFSFRKHLPLFAVKLKNNHSRSVTYISLARIMWETAEEFGIEDLYQTERVRGFDSAQRHLNQLLTSQDFKPAADSILEKMSSLDPQKDCVFLVRAGGFAPGIFRTSTLLDTLHNRTRVPVVLFYPGSVEGGTDLKFYNLSASGGIGTYNYRVNIYGGRS